MGREGKERAEGTLTDSQWYNYLMPDGQSLPLANAVQTECYIELPLALISALARG